MPPALVATKLQAPPIRRQRVDRARLLALLDPEPLPRLTLVDAPAGWGKTTLLLDWLSAARDRHRFGWLALDRGDNDPARFWTYVVEAVRTVEPGLGADALAWLRVPGTSVGDVVLPALINEMHELSDQVVLVLDDYHSIANTEIHEALAFLVDHLPSTLRLVVSTRSDPPLPLAALRVRGELTEIRAGELRFNEDETSALLNDVLELNLGSKEVGRLCERTEGWAAGLYLAALSLRGRTDSRRFIAAFAGDDRHVVDYLGAEVLAGQQEGVRSFLLETSILDRLCGSLCDEVRDAPGSASMLEAIERSNLFLVPLDEKRKWYRYHHLFGELLRHELDRAEPERVPTLHRRASAWFRAEGSASEAIKHATAAGDFAGVADLIALHWSGFLQQGELDTVADWLNALPDGVVDSDPRLCLTRAWIAVNEGRIDRIDHWVETAERAALGRADGDASTFRAAAAMLRCIQRYMEGDVGGAIEVARWARDLEPDEQKPWRSVGCPVLGIALFWRGELANATETLEEAIERAERAGNNLAVIHANSCLAAIHAERADLEGATRFAQAATGLGERHGLDEHWASTMAHVAAARALAARGRFAEAEAETTRAVELSRRGVARAEIAHALLAHAQARHDLGDREEARSLLRAAGDAVRACPDPGMLVEMLARGERQLRAGSRSAVSGDRQDEELTDRELAVLRLLPTTLSLREIGGTLYVSHNTVKSHCRSIYRKLDASGRGEAVDRARRLGLLA
jgi:LuxR family maltose regulon positive regulatory protein